MINSVLSPKTRKTLYSTFAVLMVVAGAFQTGYSAASTEQPIWLVVAIQVLAYVGGAFGFTAAVYTDTQKNTSLSMGLSEDFENSVADIGDFAPEAVESLEDPEEIKMDQE